LPSLNREQEKMGLGPHNLMAAGKRTIALRTPCFFLHTFLSDIFFLIFFTLFPENIFKIY